MKRKNFNLPAFTLLLALPLLAACTNVVSESLSDRPALELYAGVGEVSANVGSRASLDKFDNTKVMFANRLNNLPYSDATSEFWDARISIQGFVVFIPQKLYNANDLNHHLRGFYPSVPLANISAGVVSYDIDGQTDILVSTEADMQSLNNRPLMAPSVRFSHLLTQFRFSIANNATTPYRTDRHIKKITIKPTTDPSGLAQKGALDLASGSILYSSYAAETVIYDAGAGAGIAIPDAGKSKEDAAVAMFEPDKDMSVIVVYEKEDGTDETKTIPIDLSTANTSSETYPLASNSYTITFEFKGIAMTVTPSVTQWKKGYSDGDKDLPPINIW